MSKNFRSEGDNGTKHGRATGHHDFLKCLLYDDSNLLKTYEGIEACVTLESAACPTQEYIISWSSLGRKKHPTATTLAWQKVTLMARYSQEGACCNERAVIVLSGVGDTLPVQYFGGSLLGLDEKICKQKQTEHRQIDVTDTGKSVRLAK